MSKTVCLVGSIILLFSISCAKTDRPGLGIEEIKARAEESSNACLKGDYQKCVDLTYPKLVELMGGRTKMISVMEQQWKEIKAQGFEFTSA